MIFIDGKYIKISKFREVVMFLTVVSVPFS